MARSPQFQVNRNMKPINKMIEAVSALKIKLINMVTASKPNKAFLQKSYIGKSHQI